MQGESDAAKNLGSHYEVALQSLIATLASDLEVSVLPVVVSRITDADCIECQNDWEMVRDAQVAVGTGSYRSWVDTDDLNDPGDYKLNQKGFDTLGTRLACEIFSITNHEIIPAACISDVEDVDKWNNIWAASTLWLFFLAFPLFAAYPDEVMDYSRENNLTDA